MDKLTIKKYYRNTREISNTSQLENEALSQLQKDKTIVIKPADKGAVVVILSREQYIIEVERQLKDAIYYRKLDKPIYLDTIKLVTNIIDSLLRGKYINKKQHRYLIGEEEPRPRRFYILPKIHKDPATWTVPFEIPQADQLFPTVGARHIIRLNI